MEPQQVLALVGKNDFTAIMFVIFNFLGVVISALVGTVLFFVKKLIRDVQETTATVAGMSKQLESTEKSNASLLMLQTELAERMRRAEIDIAVLMSKNIEHSNGGGLHT